VVLVYSDMGYATSSTVRRATPTIVQVEWTLAMLITAWMSWISLIEESEQEDRE
jgi:hypothetical protein